MIPVEWCGVCSAAPAEGKLGILIDGEKEYIFSCESCAMKALNA